MLIYILSSLKLENNVLEGEQFLKRGYSEAIVKVFLCSRFPSTLTGGGGQAGLRGLGLKRGCL